MYYCKLHERRDEKNFLKHWFSCCCHHCQTWFFYMADQHDHIRAYYENLGLLKVKWDSNIGVLLEFPKGLMSLFDVHWPYHDKKAKKRKR